MQFESMLFKGQLYFGTIGFNQPMITPDHCSFIEMDTVLYCVPWRQTLTQRTACRRFIEECSWRYPCKEIRKAVLGRGSHWPAVRLQSTPALWSLKSSGKDFWSFPNWSKGIGPLYPFSCQVFIEELIHGKGVEASASSPLCERNCQWGTQLWLGSIWYSQQLAIRCIGPEEGIWVNTTIFAAAHLSHLSGPAGNDFSTILADLVY